MASQPLPPAGAAGGQAPLRASNSYEKELRDLDLPRPPASPTEGLESGEQSEQPQPSSSVAHPPLDTMLEAMREALPAETCDKIQGVIQQVRTPTAPSPSSHHPQSLQGDHLHKTSPPPQNFGRAGPGEAH